MANPNANIPYDRLPQLVRQVFDVDYLDESPPKLRVQYQAIGGNLVNRDANLPVWIEAGDVKSWALSANSNADVPKDQLPTLVDHIGGLVYQEAQRQYQLTFRYSNESTLSTATTLPHPEWLELADAPGLIQTTLNNVTGDIRPDADSMHAVGTSSRTFRSGHFQELIADTNLSVAGINLPTFIFNKMTNVLSAVAGSGILLTPNTATESIDIRYTGTGGGGTATDLTNITTNVLPAVDNTGEVGTQARTWADGRFTNLTVDLELTVQNQDLPSFIHTEINSRIPPVQRVPANGAPRQALLWPATGSTPLWSDIIDPAPLDVATPGNESITIAPSRRAVALSIDHLPTPTAAQATIYNAGQTVGGATWDTRFGWNIRYLQQSMNIWAGSGTGRVSGYTIPPGGTIGQVLGKASNANRDVEWIDQTGGSGIDISTLPSLGMDLSEHDLFVLEDLTDSRNENLSVTHLAQFLADGTSITANNGVLTSVSGLNIATLSAIGAALSRDDELAIRDTGGGILSKVSAENLADFFADGTTITANNGVLTAVGGGTADGVASSVTLTESGGDLTVSIARTIGAALTDTVTLPTGGGGVATPARVESVTFQALVLNETAGDPGPTVEFVLAATNPITVEQGSGSAEMLSGTGGAGTFTIARSGVYAMEWRGTIVDINDRSTPCFEVRQESDNAVLSSTQASYFRFPGTYPSIVQVAHLRVPSDDLVVNVATRNCIERIDQDDYTISAGSKIYIMREAGGLKGDRGSAGPDGAAGPAGAAGQGVPAGGSGTQILAKSSATDYDTEWIDAPSGGGSGLTLEQIQDAMDTFIIDGTNIETIYSDSADTLLIKADGGVTGANFSNVGTDLHLTIGRAGQAAVPTSIALATVVPIPDSVTLDESGGDLTITIGRSTGDDLTDTVSLPSGGGTWGAEDSRDATTAFLEAGPGVSLHRTDNPNGNLVISTGASIDRAPVLLAFANNGQAFIINTLDPGESFREGRDQPGLLRRVGGVHVRELHLRPGHISRASWSAPTLPTCPRGLSAARSRAQSPTRIRWRRMGRMSTFSTEGRCSRSTTPRARRLPSRREARSSPSPARSPGFTYHNGRWLAVDFSTNPGLIHVNVSNAGNSTEIGSLGSNVNQIESLVSHAGFLYALGTRTGGQRHVWQLNEDTGAATSLGSDIPLNSDFRGGGVRRSAVHHVLRPRRLQPLLHRCARTELPARPYRLRCFDKVLTGISGTGDPRLALCGYWRAEMGRGSFH